MKKNKKGFTLAEVATALAIVGIIAALTIPQVVSLVQKQRSGAILGRAVEQIELGCQNMIQYANSKYLESSHADALELISMKDLDISDSTEPITVTMGSIAPSFWGLSPIEIPSSEIKTIKKYNGDNDTGADFLLITQDTTKRYNFTKSPGAVAISTEVVDATNPTHDLSSNTYIYVYIDTNGWDKNPNTYGKDIFAFNILNSGKLKATDTGSSGLEYTQKVVKEGFKINY